jgi:hypothetical protein
VQYTSENEYHACRLINVDSYNILNLADEAIFQTVTLNDLRKKEEIVMERPSFSEYLSHNCAFVLRDQICAHSQLRSSRRKEFVHSFF